MQRVGVLHEQLQDVISVLQPDAIPLSEVTALWKQFDAIERLAAAGKTLLARRVDDAGAWKASGFRSAAEAMAAASGTSIISQKHVIEMSRRVADLPATAEALKAGALSSAKAEAIASAASVAPDRERELLSKANETLQDLRDACRNARMAVDGDAMYERIRENRGVSDFTDADGAWNLHAVGPADAGAIVRRRLDKITDELFKAARKEGRREPREAYAFDALVEMARRAGGASPRKSSAELLALLRLDLEALQRGHTEGGELCELTGIGPIPVSRARELMGDAVLKLVITKGTDVIHVTHLGRRATAAQRAALMWESPRCRVKGCSGLRVQIDHREGWAKTHTTRLDDLDPLCPHHHDLKTREGWSLVDGTGARDFVPPSDPRHPRNRPPP